RTMGIPKRSAKAKSQELNLDSYYNFGLDENLHGLAGNNFNSLPKGLQRFGQVEFDVRGLVQLANRGTLEKSCPAEIRGMPVGLTCRTVHFLHATGWGGSVSS